MRHSTWAGVVVGMLDLFGTLMTGSKTRWLHFSNY